MDRIAVAKRLRTLRGKRTQAEVSRDLDITQSSYAMYETAQRMPSDEVKERFAKYYNLTVQAIFFD